MGTHDFFPGALDGLDGENDEAQDGADGLKAVPAEDGTAVPDGDSGLGEGLGGGLGGLEIDLAPGLGLRGSPRDQGTDGRERHRQN